ncbi:MAG: hypothetical protein AAFV59_08310 [Pseudomonadota bacterium]
MPQTLVKGSRILALVGGIALISAPALARDVTVYGGGTSTTYKADEDKGVRVFAYGKARETQQEKRLKRFNTERKVQSIIETRDSDDARETSDAMLRVILNGDRDARRQRSIYYPYSAQSDGFYNRLDRKIAERKAGVRVYRQSILDKTTDEDLDRISEALED